jgi:integrase
VHRCLHKALIVAVEWNLLARNPAAIAKPPKVQAREIEIITVEQAQKLLRCLRGRALYPIIMLALATGMRRGELLALRWCDVDLDAGTAQVARSLEQTKAGLRFKEPKTKHGRRSIKFSASVVAELKAHWKQQQERRLKLGQGRAVEGDLVFPSWDGTVRSPNATTRGARSGGIQVAGDQSACPPAHACEPTHCCRHGPGCHQSAAGPCLPHHYFERVWALVR